MFASQWAPENSSADELVAGAFEHVCQRETDDHDQNDKLAEASSCPGSAPPLDEVDYYKAQVVCLKR